MLSLSQSNMQIVITQKMSKLLFILALFCCLTVTGQSEKVNLSIPEFLVGMSNDYNGKVYYLDHPKESLLITNFFCGQYISANIFIDSIYSFAEGQNQTIEIVNDKSIDIYSEGLIELFKSYYRIDKKPEEYFLENYNTPEEKEFGIYRAKLKRRKFNSRHKKLSYLLGVFVKYGELTDDELIKVSLANSHNHYETSLRFCRQLGFKIVDKQNCKEGWIPCTRSYTIRITPKYRTQINNIFKSKQAEVNRDNNIKCKN